MTTSSIFDEKPEVNVEQRKPVISKQTGPTGGAGFEGLAWVIVIIAAALAVFVLVTGMSSATGAPQEAVVCALACAIVILPYCAARAIAHLRRLDD
jgi:hypothetical protein